MATATETHAKRPGAGIRTRVIYRSSSGKVHLEWPADRIAEALEDAGGTLWVDVENTNGDVAPIEALFRDTFHFHQLAIEDALQETHVPKVDAWDRYLYTVFHVIDFDPESDALRLHELDLFLGQNYLVSYHSEPMPVVERLRDQVRRDEGSRLKLGPDHLLYQILDAGVEEYMGVIEHLDDAIDRAQDEVFDSPTRSTVQDIFQIKRAALRLHRILGPQREVVNRLARDPYPQIDAEDRVYFRDVYDHLVRLHDITEGLRDLIAGALDTYLSAISNRTNDSMKTLTLVTVMFLPMSFLAGFFGMNFFGETLEFHAPLLPKTALFWSSCMVMLGTPVGLWLWGKRRGWF